MDKNNGNYSIANPLPNTKNEVSNKNEQEFLSNQNSPEDKDQIQDNPQPTEETVPT